MPVFRVNAETLSNIDISNDERLSIERRKRQLLSEIAARGAIQIDH